MIFMVTIWYPSDKAIPVADTFAKASKEPIPDYIKRWQIYMTPDGPKGMKSYQVIMSEKGKGDEALFYINKTLVPFMEIEGYEWKIENLMGVKDSFKLLG